MTQEYRLLRRVPRQARSRELVERVLEASIAVLDEGGMAQLTTNRVARVAEIEIATLYQYFPNKEAILYTLVERWIQQAQNVYAQHQPQADDNIPFLRAVRAITSAMERLPANDWGYRHLGGLVESVPVLRELEAEHETYTAKFWAGLFRHYGVAWDDVKLETFARLCYAYLNTALTLAGRSPQPQAGYILRWQRRQMLGMMRQIFPRKKSRQH